MEHAIDKGRICPYCDGFPEMRHTEHQGFVMRCPSCEDVWVTCHEGTLEPKGRLADSRLRRMRVLAHKWFDPLYKERKDGRGGSGDGIALINLIVDTYQEGVSNRSKAYDWLFEKIGKEHIGEMDLEECRKVVALCRPIVKYLRG